MTWGRCGEREFTEPAPGHRPGADIGRLSVSELRALEEACRAEMGRIDQEIAAKGETRAAADGLFRR